MGRKNKGDIKLQDLPYDSDEETDSRELALLNNILSINKRSPEEYNTLKYVLFATGIFIVLSLPFTDRILELAIPVTQSWLILLGLKTILFFILYYIVFYVNK